MSYTVLLSNYFDNNDIKLHNCLGFKYQLIDNERDGNGNGLARQRQRQRHEMNGRGNEYGRAYGWACE